MCRYSTPYKEHYACFNCRKMFKQLPNLDWQNDGPRVIVCPQCRVPMHNLGKDFKPPKQTDVKQWQKVERLFKSGITFHSCGCCGPGPRPATLLDVEPFLAELKRTAMEKQRQRAIAERAAALHAKRKKAERTIQDIRT